MGTASATGLEPAAAGGRRRGRRAEPPPHPEAPPARGPFERWRPPRPRTESPAETQRGEKRMMPTLRVADRDDAEKPTDFARLDRAVRDARLDGIDRLPLLVERRDRQADVQGRRRPEVAQHSLDDEVVAGLRLRVVGHVHAGVGPPAAGAAPSSFASSSRPDPWEPARARRRRRSHGREPAALRASLSRPERESAPMSATAAEAAEASRPAPLWPRPSRRCRSPSQAPKGASRPCFVSRTLFPAASEATSARCSFRRAARRRRRPPPRSRRGPGRASVGGLHCCSFQFWLMVDRSPGTISGGIMNLSLARTCSSLSRRERHLRLRRQVRRPGLVR